MKENLSLFDNSEGEWNEERRKGWGLIYSCNRPTPLVKMTVGDVTATDYFPMETSHVDRPGRPLRVEVYRQVAGES